MAGFGTLVGGPVASAGGIGTRVGVGVVSLATDNRGLTAGFRQADMLSQQWARKYGTTVGASLYQSSRKLSAVGSAMTRSLTLPLLAAGGAATAYASRFNKAMATTVALGGVVSRNLGEMTDRVKELAVAFGRDPLEVANSLYFLSSAGLKANEVMTALKGSAQGAATGLGTADDVGRTLISTLNAYRGTGITVQKVLDTLVAATKAGNIETTELSATIGAVIPQAAQLGISFDQVAGAIAATTNIGVEAYRAVTGLRYILVALQRPTEKAKDAFKDYGLTIEGIQKNLADPKVGLLGTLQMIAQRFDLTSVKGREAWNTILGGIRGTIVAQALVGQNLEGAIKTVGKVRDAYVSAGSEAKKAFSVIKETPAFKFEQAWTKLKVAAIDAGNVVLPIAAKIVDAVGNLAAAFSSLPEPIQNTVVQLGLLLALAGPVLSILGKLGQVAAVVAAQFAGGIGGAMTGAGAPAGVLGGLTAQAALRQPSVTQGLAAFAAQGIPVQGRTAAGAFTSLEAAEGLYYVRGAGILTAAEVAAEAAPVGFFAKAHALTAPGVIPGLGIVSTIAAIALSYKAFKDIQKLQDQTTKAAEDWSTAVKKGTGSLADLQRGLSQATEGGPGWFDQIPIISHMIDTMADSQTIKAGQAAIDDINKSFNKLTHDVLRAPGAWKTWHDTIDSETADASLSARRNFGAMLDAVAAAGIELTRQQKQRIDMLFQAGLYRPALNALLRATQGDLKGAMRDYNGLLTEEQRKQIMAAEAAGHHLQALKLLAQFQQSAYQQQDKIEKQQQAQLSAAGGIRGTVPYMTANQGVQFAPAHAEIQAYNRLAAALRGSGKVGAGEAVNVSGMLAKFFAAGGKISGDQMKVFLKQIDAGKTGALFAYLREQVQKTGFEMPKVKERLDKQFNTMAESFQFLVHNLTRDVPLFQQHLSALVQPGGRALWGDLKPPQIATVMAQMQRTVQAHPDIFVGKVGERRQLQFLATLAEGNVKRDVALLQKWIEDQDPSTLKVDADMSPFLATVQSTVQGIGSIIIDVGTSLVPPPGAPPGAPPRHRRRRGGGGTASPRQAHAGGWIERHDGGWLNYDEVAMIGQRDEFVMRRTAARRNARLLERLNAGGSVPGMEDLSDIRASLHHVMQAMARQQTQPHGGGGHGHDIFLDGYKVGRTMSNRERRMARG